MSARFDKYIKELEGLLRELCAADPLRLSEVVKFPIRGGCYALVEKDKYLYVGISKNLRQRMRNHTSGRPEQSVFAYKVACEITGRKSDYTKAGSKKVLIQIPEFAEAMKSTTQRVRQMDAKCIVIEDASQRYLFEFFAALSLDAPYNDFNTH
jgi:hypothetical protein